MVIAWMVIAALAVIALAYVSAPALGPVDDDIEPGGEPSELEDRKVAALTGILDIEEERAIGKLSDEDFASLRAKYETEALEALNALDERDGALESDPLESEIAEMKRRLVCPVCGAIRGGLGRTAGQTRSTGVCERCEESSSS